uniref:Uncharacterized protein n=1 Tax=Solanum lycopersicum TaxID=4081 RepID=A0A3Q7ILL6_SOLLC
MLSSFKPHGCTMRSTAPLSHWCLRHTRQGGKGEDRTCSSGGLGLAVQIPMPDPSLAPQGAVPRAECTTWRCFLCLCLVLIWIILQVSDFGLIASPQKVSSI